MVNVRQLLTRGYARFSLGGVQDSEQYQSQGIEATVYWVDADDWMAGQYTPWGTILLNKYELRDRSKALTDYTFLHEVGHSRMPILPNLLLTPLRLLLTAALLAVPFAAPLYFSGTLPTADSSLPVIVGAYLLVASIIVGFYVVVSWIDEGYAELFVLSKIGESRFRECHREVRENRTAGLLKMIWHRLTYPQPRVVLWFYRRLGHRL